MKKMLSCIMIAVIVSMSACASNGPNSDNGPDSYPRRSSHQH